MSVYFSGSYQGVPYMHYSNGSSRYCGYNKVKSAMPQYPYLSYYPANSYAQWPVPHSAFNTSNFQGMSRRWVNPSSQYNRPQPVYWNQRLDGESLSTFGGAARLYLPHYNYRSGFKPITNTRPMAHPTYFNPQPINLYAGGNSGYGDLISSALGGGHGRNPSKYRKATHIPNVSPARNSGPTGPAVMKRSSTAHRSKRTDSNYCRACPPAPPMLNIPVKKYHWMQQCSACQNTPSSSFVSNGPSTHGRITPLLGERVSASPKQTPYSPADRYPHVNTPDLMRPWSTEIPPLPPGVVVVADYYTTRSNAPGQWYPTPSEDSRRRSREKNITRDTSKKRYPTVERAKRKDHSTRESASSTSGSSYTSTCSTCVSSSDTLVESGKHSTGDSGYNYQPQESSSVHQTNHYLKSESEDSNASRPTEPATPLTKESSEKEQQSSASQRSSMMSKESRPCPASTSLESKISELRTVLTRELTTSSPSSESTASSDPELMDLANSVDPRAETSASTSEDENAF